MVKIHIEYVGDLRCRLRHVPSGTEIMTDAPKDHEGKGELFSPTDLVAAGLGSCVATMMGIVARHNQFDLKKVTIELTKEMAPKPGRRIGHIATTVQMPEGVPAELREKLERAADACPVGRSLHPEVVVELSFKYPD